MSEPFSIRKAEAADYARITRLLSDAALPLDGLPENSTGHENFLVLCRDGGVLGCAAIERYGQYGLLRSVALELHERRHGLGRRLVQEALQQARRDGLAEVVLLTTTDAPFFARLGVQAVRSDAVPVPLRIRIYADYR